jgi:hypothetical protein
VDGDGCSSTCEIEKYFACENYIDGPSNCRDVRPIVYDLFSETFDYGVMLNFTFNKKVIFLKEPK